jgi:membrane protease YdiL (CAAX protease family)
MSRRVVVPILVFLVASSVASPLLAQAQDRLGLSPDILRLTVFSTAVGAAVTWAIWRRKLAYPAVTRPSLIGPLLAAQAVCLLAAGLMFAAALAQGSPWRPPNLAGLGAPLAVVMLVQVIGAGAEEVGWRGIVQPLLETRMRPYAAALIAGVLFAVGHVYLLAAVSPLSFALFCVSAVGLSLVLAAFTIGRSAVNRIVIATLTHFSVNMATFFLFADGDGSPRYFATQAAVFGVLGAGALAVLLRQPNPRADLAPGVAGG